MTATATKNRKSATPAPAKPATAEVQPSETPAPAKTEAKPEKATKVTVSTYREMPQFVPALKAARSLAKGNVDLTQPLQLITHLAWKTPGGSVGWAKGTTANVIAYADDIAVPTGTPIPEAMAAALSAAEKAAADKPQREAVAILAQVIKGHTA